MRLIISIYGGVPEAFEVFHCRPTTTEEELRLFLNPRRATKKPFQYMILEVNRLPYPLQEVGGCCHCITEEVRVQLSFITGTSENAL